MYYRVDYSAVPIYELYMKWWSNTPTITIGKEPVIVSLHLTICSNTINCLDNGHNRHPRPYSREPHIDELVQDCSNSSTIATELQQSFTKQSICGAVCCEGMVLLK